MGVRPRRHVFLLFLTVALLALIWLVWPWAKAACFLYDLAEGGAVLSRQSVSYAPAGIGRGGDYYSAPGGAASGIVLVPGASPTGKDDPALVRFASALARAGFDVLVPDIVDARQLRVGPGDADDIADALAWMAGRKANVGIAAISYAVGPAVLAALRPGSRAGFILGIGGYDDVEAVIGFFTTGWYREDGVWRQLVPNAYGRWAFARANAARLSDSGDRAMLEAIAQRRMADGAAPIDDLVRPLTPSARAVVDLLENLDRARVHDLLNGLPEPLLGDIRALDLSRRDLSALKARLILVHGRDDTIIPAGESAKLAAAAPHARLFIADDLAHTRWSPRHAQSILTLLRAARELLNEAR